MIERVLRLRSHHCFQLYLYQMYGGKEEYIKRTTEYAMSPSPEDKIFRKKVAEKMQGFWDNEYTHVDVVPVADDICEVCNKECNGRYEAETPDSDFRITGRGIEMRRYTSKGMQDFIRKTWMK